MQVDDLPTPPTPTAPPPSVAPPLPEAPSASSAPPVFEAPPASSIPPATTPPVVTSPGPVPPVVASPVAVEQPAAEAPTSVEVPKLDPPVAATEYRATIEDFVLWGVITAVLGFLAWYLHVSTGALSDTFDVDRLATYGMNVRANFVLMISAALALIGCAIVLRRVRTAFTARASADKVRANVVADSAGIVIVVLAVVLLAITITHPPRFERGSSVPPSAASDRALEDYMNGARDAQATDPAPPHEEGSSR